ncbi:MAG: C40 family peptidase [Gemmatimonadota bacterium]
MTTALICVSTVAPIQAEPSLRSEQVSQLLHGRVADVTAAQGEWRRIRVRLDTYEGWVNIGYAREVDVAEADAWEAAAVGWSEGAVTEVRDRLIRIPLGGRVQVDPKGGIVMPGGRRGKLLSGRVPPADTIAKEARAMPVDKWVAKFFTGAPYQWGGATPWGVDCSGLVQMTFAARGIALPRDSFLQADVGEPVVLETARAGDLLYFSENGRSITHVAMIGSGDTLLHSTLSCGGFVQEQWGPGTRAEFLRDVFVSGRRLPRGDGPAL